MNIDIRSYIMSNFKNDTKDSLKASIEDSIAEHDEETLPGLGVFFELLWNNSNDDEKNKILSVLEESVKSNK
jgi:small acid-soluble spore protein I (minor)